MLSQEDPSSHRIAILYYARESLIKEDEGVQAKGKGFQFFLPVSEQSMICLSVDISVALICHVTFCLGVWGRGKKDK